MGSPEVHENNGKILPLPFSALAFEQIRKAWNLPTELLRMMQSTLPLASTVFVDGPDEKQHHIGL